MSPTLRSAAILMALCAALAVGCRTDTPAGDSAPESSAPEMELFVSGIVRQDPNDERIGWDYVTIPLGVRNTGSTPVQVSIPGSGSLGIAEGDVTYEATVQFEEGDTQRLFSLDGEGNRGPFQDLTLPPGVAVCRVMTFESRSKDGGPLFAVSEVPSGLRPVSLTVGDYPRLDLTAAPRSDECSPDVSKMTTSTQVSLTAPDMTAEEASGVLQLQGAEQFPDAFSSVGTDGQTKLNANLRNTGRFRDFHVEDLSLWLVDGDGTLRSPRMTGSGDSTWAGTNCENVASHTVAPQIQVRANACYAYREDPPVGVLYNSSRMSAFGASRVTTKVSRAEAPLSGETASSSSIEKKSLGPGKAFDNDTTGTRWGSFEGVDPQWLELDLGASRHITHVQLFWETAYAQSYEIQVSDDEVTWTTIYRTASGDGGKDDLTGLDGNGRYVRMYGTERGTPFGYSLYEMQVFGT